MKRIAIEEHFTTKVHVDALRSMLEKKYHQPEVVEEEKYLSVECHFLDDIAEAELHDEVYSTGHQLIDLGEGRVRQMAEDGIDMQALSLTEPGVQVFDPATGSSLAREINDILAEAVRKYPDRFVGLATIAPQDPAEAAKELERCVQKLDLRGALINSHTKGEYLDQKKYWVIFECAEKLGAPIYIHPRFPPPDMMGAYLDYPMLGGAMHGFSSETSLHALRLICSGVFDAYPKLNIILGHLGEALPFWLWRLDSHWDRSPLASKLKRTPSEYIRNNFYVTTSGMFGQPPFMCAYLALGAERILFAVDYPFQTNKEAIQFMELAPICDSDKEKICHLNAERLFRL